MIIIAGTAQVRPEKREAAVAAALKMAQATQAENGCLAYNFYADLEAATTFFVFEVWENEAALTQHFETPHMAEFRQQLPDLLAGEMDIKRYDVEAVSPA
jgi:quinol monooxygenase YgiN